MLNLSTNTFTQVTPQGGAGRRLFVNHAHIVSAGTTKGGEATAITLSNGNVLLVDEPVWAVLGIPLAEVPIAPVAKAELAKPGEEARDEEQNSGSETKTLTEEEAAALEMQQSAHVKSVRKK